MTTETNDRSGFLANLNDEQAALYHNVNQATAASGDEFWKGLSAAEASAEDKFQVAEAMGYPHVADSEYAEAAGRDPHRGKVDMNSLEAGDQFIGPDDKTRYAVKTPASQHEHGWTEVRDLSMTDEQAAAAGASDGNDPRDGFFSYSHPTYVQRDTEQQRAARRNAELASAAEARLVSREQTSERNDTADDADGM